MTKSRLLASVASALTLILSPLGIQIGARAAAGRSLGRYRFADMADPMAFTFRMPAGFAGDVNRTHPASIAPYMNDPTIPVTAYGLLVVANTVANTVRNVQAADAASVMFGFSVRPFPFQQQSGGMTASFGSASVPTTAQMSALDVLKSGFIMAAVQGACTLGAPVYVWTAVNSGNHVQGGLEAVNPAGNGILLANAYFNGPADAGGIVEVAYNL